MLLNPSSCSLTPPPQRGLDDDSNAHSSLKVVAAKEMRWVAALPQDTDRASLIPSRQGMEEGRANYNCLSTRQFLQAV